MLVICRDHKICGSRKNCSHSKLHIHNSISYQKCVNVEYSACFCNLTINEIRKQKLKKIYELR